MYQDCIMFSTQTQPSYHLPGQIRPPHLLRTPTALSSTSEITGTCPFPLECPLRYSNSSLGPLSVCPSLLLNSPSGSLLPCSPGPSHDPSPPPPLASSQLALRLLASLLPRPLTRSLAPSAPRFLSTRPQAPCFPAPDTSVRAGGQGLQEHIAST